MGEALVDLVISPAGEVEAALGGAPFNTARACGRLGTDVEFIGALSTDRFGCRLAAALESDGVDVLGAPRVDFPTTLAAAELDERGAAVYRFYVDGTSAPALDTRPDVSGTDVIFTGGLALVLEPMGSVVEATLAARPAGATVMVDVNCRPQLIASRDAYRVRVERVLANAEIVKASDDDLAYLYPAADLGAAAQRVLQLGVGVVLVTTGAAGVKIVSAAGSVDVPVVPVDVVDTVGAGDTFDGALLAWLTANGAVGTGGLSLESVERAVRAANLAAGLACTRRGADPPSLADLGPGWWS